ncbi:hypothetical protein R1CP_38805 (plasmid) [Rhodococcus opacus]|uniref:Uncharacterized protein n=1 Tax=Rhodococcus opacus TaxID=37919 RepID=A0A1B1KIB1_RHOOP|nr:hypothetical protein R1CP_38300 [Rhodococcus opacus]ANS32349.1 hypothetical protein R1CP_38805 [Rhodococcus opacus]
MVPGACVRQMTTETIRTAEYCDRRDPHNLDLREVRVRVLLASARSVTVVAGAAVVAVAAVHVSQINKTGTTVGHGRRCANGHAESAGRGVRDGIGLEDNGAPIVADMQ